MINKALPDLLSFIVDNRGRTCPTAESGFPLIATNCLKTGRRAPVFENVRYVDDVTMKTWFRSHPEPGDVLFVCKGSPGRVAVVPDPVSFCIAQDMVALRANPSVVDPGYLYYRLLARDVQAAIQNMHVGTMIPHFKKGDFGKLTFNIHRSVSAQRAIAEVLGVLDDKIAANDRVMRLTHELMIALYEAARCKGSFTKLVGEAAEFLNRRRVPLSSREREARKGDVPYYGAAGPLGFVDEALFDEELVLVGEDGTVIRENGAPVIQYIWRPAWVNNHAHVLRGEAVSTPLLRVALEKSNVTHLVTGAVQPKISMGNLKSLRLEIPADTEVLEGQLGNLSKLLQAVTIESERLATTRDELLPLLMSGRVRVKDAEQSVEEVL